MRRQHGSGGAGSGNRQGGARKAFLASIGAVTLAIAASAASVYFLFAIVTGADVVPRSTDDLRALGLISLAIGGFAVAMAVQDELRALQRGVGEAPEGPSGASPKLTSSGSTARPEPSR